MRAADIVVIGVKQSVIAIHRRTGVRLWESELKGGLGGGFVSLLADHGRVYAHTCGELYCLDLFNGSLLWHDPLSGLGYGLASIALPGQQLTSPLPACEHLREQDETSSNSSASATPGSTH